MQSVVVLPQGPVLGAVEHVGLAIIERYGREVLFLVFLLPVSDEVLRHPVAEREVPVGRAEQRIEEVRTVAYGIQAAHQATHAGAEHHVHGYAFLLEEAEHSDVGRALGAAAAEHERHGRAAAPYAVHPGPHPGHYHRVSDGVVTLEIHLCSGRQSSGQE